MAKTVTKQSMDYSVQSTSVKSASNVGNNNKRSAQKIMYSCTK